MTTETSTLPTTRQTRYDRQLRLWGDDGQKRLEQAHVCLLNATAAGCEVLKSLVLPGVGAYTVIDHHPVGGDDVGVNYFLQHEDIGDSRAHAVVRHLNVREFFFKLFYLP